MKKTSADVSARIRQEFGDLNRALERINHSRRQAKLSGDDAYWDSVALNLHSLYDGLERLFELIAVNVDGHKPGGQNWHALLLYQMAEERPGVRPAVISIASKETLDDWRGFRHIVRHVYTFRFDLVRLEKRAETASQILHQVAQELHAFADFLDQQAALGDEPEQTA